MGFKMKGPSTHKGTERHRKEVKNYEELKVKRDMDKNMPDGKSTSSPFQLNEDPSPSKFLGLDKASRADRKAKRTELKAARKEGRTNRRQERRDEKHSKKMARASETNAERKERKLQGRRKIGDKISKGIDEMAKGEAMFNGDAAMVGALSKGNKKKKGKSPNINDDVAKVNKFLYGDDKKGGDKTAATSTVKKPAKKKPTLKQQMAADKKFIKSEGDKVTESARERNPEMYGKSKAQKAREKRAADYKKANDPLRKAGKALMPKYKINTEYQKKKIKK